MVPLILAGISLASAYMASREQENQGDIAKKVGEYNSRVDESDALQLSINAQENIRRMREEGRKFVGSQRAKYAASGVVVDTGSPLEVMAETEGVLRMQQLEEQRAADAKAANLRRQAQMSRLYGEEALRASQIQSTATLLGGAANAASMYYGMRR